MGRMNNRIEKRLVAFDKAQHQLHKFIGIINIEECGFITSGSRFMSVRKVGKKHWFARLTKFGNRKPPCLNTRRKYKAISL